MISGTISQGQPVTSNITVPPGTYWLDVQLPANCYVYVSGVTDIYTNTGGMTIIQRMLQLNDGATIRGIAGTGGVTWASDARWHWFNLIRLR